jgi:hypothetical protein
VFSGGNNHLGALLNIGNLMLLNDKKSRHVFFKLFKSPFPVMRLIIGWAVFPGRCIQVSVGGAENEVLSMLMRK